MWIWITLQGGGCDGAGRKITVGLGRGSSNATQIGHGFPRQYVLRKGALVPGLSARRVSLGRRYYCRRADVELVAQFGDAVVGLEQGENGHGRVLELEKYARRQSKRK